MVLSVNSGTQMVKTEGHKLSGGLNVTLLTICYPVSLSLPHLCASLSVRVAP